MTQHNFDEKKINCPGCGRSMSVDNNFCSRKCCLVKAGLSEDTPVSEAIKVLGL